MSAVLVCNGVPYGGDGVLPELYIYTKTTTTVVVKKGSEVMTTTKLEDGVYLSRLFDYGVYTVTDGTTSKSIEVDVCKEYEMAFDVSLLDLTYADTFKGATITCTKGSTTLTKTAPSNSNNIAFFLTETGTWTVSSTVSNITYSITVTVSALGDSISASLLTIPDGETVTPTDDIQIWLHCANITDKNYTTLAQVLADRETYNTLLGNRNSIAYMKRCYTFAQISEPLIPVMTSNTTPSGEASASSTSTTNFAPWKAMSRYDSDNYDRWVTAENVENAYIQYQFASPVVARRVSFKSRPTARKSQDTAVDCQIKVQASNDGSTFTDLGTFDVLAVNADKVENYDFSNETEYSYYRVRFVGSNVLYSSKKWCGLTLLQFYSQPISITTDRFAMQTLADYEYCTSILLTDPTWLEAFCASECAYLIFPYAKGLIPTMTSASAPKGVVTDGGVVSQSGYGASYLVFSSDVTKKCIIAQTSYIRYAFTNPVKATSFYFAQDSITATGSERDFIVQGSNDATNWTTLTSFAMTVGESEEYGVLSNTDEYTYYQIKPNGYTGGAGNSVVKIFQLYNAPEVSPTLIHSAACDTLYYTDNESNFTLAITDSKGTGNVSYPSIPEGEYTIYSSVAKDPNSEYLGSYYSKTVYISKDTAEIFIMPDNVLYWYGYFSQNCEEISFANGYTNSGWSSNGRTIKSPTYNINYIYCGEKMSYKGISTKVSYPIGTKFYIIAEGTIKDSYGSFVVRSYEAKNFQDSDTIDSTWITSLNTIENINVELTGDYYARADMNDGGSSTTRAGNLYAFWYELGE